jgi:glycosyltransferase involved in cell wall biosynthesis
MRATSNIKSTLAGLNCIDGTADGATVAVVIPTFNQAHFLSDAITSVLAQTRQADEIIVVDDGSTDDPGAVTSRFRKVKLIRQENRGRSAARNVGLRSCAASHVVFLDSDDRLLPTALQTGLNCIADRPDCAFVYGGYRLISENGQPFGPDCFSPAEWDAHLALLRSCLLGPPATGLYRRDCLIALNGFDERLRGPEDFDLYLRITQSYPIASHPELVAEYRRHGHNTTNNHLKQLEAVLGVLDLHEARITIDPATRAALDEGRAGRRAYYVAQMLTATGTRWRAQHDIGGLVWDLVRAARWSPAVTLRMLVGGLASRIKAPLRATMRARQRAWRAVGRMVKRNDA